MKRVITVEDVPIKQSSDDSSIYVSVVVAVVAFAIFGAILWNQQNRISDLEFKVDALRLYNVQVEKAAEKLEKEIQAEAGIEQLEEPAQDSENR